MVRMGGMSSNFGNRGFNNIRQFQFGPAWNSSNNRSSSRPSRSGGGGYSEEVARDSSGNTLPSSNSKACYYFPFLPQVKAYDLSSYKPEQLEGRVTKEQCEILTNELAANNIIGREDFCRPGCCTQSWIIIAATLIFSFTYLGVALSQTPYYGRSAEMSNGLPVLFLVGTAVLIFQLCINNYTEKKLQEKNWTVFSLILSKHKSTTFAGVDVDLIIEAYHSVKIVAKWPNVTPEMVDNQGKAQEGQNFDERKIEGEKPVDEGDHSKPPGLLRMATPE